MYSPLAAAAARLDRARAIDRMSKSMRDRKNAEKAYLAAAKSKEKKPKVNESNIFVLISKVVLMASLSLSCAQYGGIVSVCAFDGIAVAPLTSVVALRVPVTTLILIESNKNARTWGRSNLDAFRRLHKETEIHYVENVDLTTSALKVIDFLGEKVVNVYTDASPCCGSSGSNAYRTNDLSDNGDSAWFIDSVALMGVLQARQPDVPIAIFKEFVANYAHAPQITAVFDLPPVWTDAIVSEIAPRGRLWWANVELLEFHPMDLVDIDVPTPADVLSGAARDRMQHYALTTVCTQNHNLLCRRGAAIDVRTALHPYEKLACLGLPGALAANNPSVSNAQAGHEGAGNAWALYQAGLVLLPIAVAWEAIGGKFISEGEAAKYLARY